LIKFQHSTRSSRNIQQQITDGTRDELRFDALLSFVVEDMFAWTLDGIKDSPAAKGIALKILPLVLGWKSVTGSFAAAVFSRRFSAFREIWIAVIAIS
jgi:hypothetical protein